MPVAGENAKSVHVVPLRDLPPSKREEAALERNPKLAAIKELYLGAEPLSYAEIARRVGEAVCDCTPKSVTDAIVRYGWAGQRKLLDSQAKRLTREARAAAGLEAADRKARPETPDEIIAAGTAILAAIKARDLAGAVDTALHEDLRFLGGQLAMLEDLAAEVSRLRHFADELTPDGEPLSPREKSDLVKDYITLKLTLAGKVAEVSGKLITLRRSILSPPEKKSAAGGPSFNFNLGDPGRLAELEAQKAQLDRHFDAPAHSYRVLPAPGSGGVTTREHLDALLSGDFDAAAAADTLARTLAALPEDDEPQPQGATDGQPLAAPLPAAQPPAGHGGRGFTGGGNPGQVARLTAEIERCRAEFGPVGAASGQIGRAHV